MKDRLTFLKNNDISKKRYLENTCNSFKTDIYPVIQLNSAVDWEVAVLSAIIPFIGYNEKEIIDKAVNEKCLIAWNFFFWNIW